MTDKCLIEPFMPRVGIYGERHRYPLDYAVRKRFVVRDIELGLLSKDDIAYFISDATVTVNEVREAKEKQVDLSKLLDE